MYSSWSSNSISVVVVSCNEGAYLRRTVHSLLASLPADGEIVVVDDASKDGSADFLASGYSGVTVLRSQKRLGVASARNFGARQARGEVIVFSDAHVETPLGWWEPLVGVLDKPGIGAVAPAVAMLGQPERKGYGLTLTGPKPRTKWLSRRQQEPYPVPILCGCFLAMRRDIFESTGGFDSGLIQYGWNDSEISLRFWLSGHELWVVPEVSVAHLFKEKRTFQVEWAAFLHNLLRMAFAHLSGDRLSRVVESAKGRRDFARAIAMVVDSDLWMWRSQLAAQRVRSDEWLFNHFNIVI